MKELKVKIEVIASDGVILEKKEWVSLPALFYMILNTYIFIETIIIKYI